MTASTPEPTSEPTRTCIGCRARRGRSELLRFAADGDTLRVGAGRPGRGAWLCRATLLDCFDRATDRRQWGRALRTPLDPASLVALRGQLASGMAPGPLG